MFQKQSSRVRSHLSKLQDFTENEIPYLPQVGDRKREKMFKNIK